MATRKQETQPVGHWSAREFLHVSGSRWLVMVGLAAMLGVPAALHRTTSLVNPPPAPEAPLPLQEWTTDARMQVLASVVLGAKPRIDPRQKSAPCDPDVEEEHYGVCWTPLKVPPPCPKGKTWENAGTCYQAVLKAAKAPTSGGARTGAVAEP
jgi:hypothetical protein